MKSSLVRMFLFAVALVIVVPAVTPMSVFAGDAAAQNQPMERHMTDEEAEAAAAGCCAAFAGIMILIPLVIIILSIILGLWMYKDAQRRGDPQAAMWLVIGIIFNLVGLMIYLVVRKNRNVPPPPPPMA